MKKHGIMMVVATACVTLAPASSSWAQFDFLRNLGQTDEPATPSKVVAYFKLEGPMAETPTAIPPLLGRKPSPSLKSVLDRLKKARHDSNVVAVVVDLQDVSVGLGQMEELSAALKRSSAADKPVYVHADALTTITYVAACGASHLSLVPTGELWLTGLYGEALYLRGMLDKIGAFPDFERCGDYKSAVETFTRTGPSEEGRRMRQWLFDGLFESLVTTLAENRRVAPAEARRLIDEGPYSAEEALAQGLIDSVRHRQDFVDDLLDRYGHDCQVVGDYGADKDFMPLEDSFMGMFEFMMKLLNPKPKEYTQPSVAVVYVEGPIMTGEAEPSLTGASEGAFSTTIRRALDEAAEDHSVKAVVLRVDSPGGSALASEIILNAARRVAASKPLVVSMGNVAGSGGYYVTCAAQTIFADRGTITASIGVLGGKLVTTGTWNRLGVNWDAEKRGAMAGLFSSATPFSDEERLKLRHHLDLIYEVFKGHVVSARGERLKKPIDEMAGGRVFTGQQAMELGLVDRIGGLEDAVRFAAERAGLGEFELRVIPEPKSLFDLFAGALEDEPTIRSSVGRATLLGLSNPMIEAALQSLQGLDPARARALIRALQRVELMQIEGTLMMMPEEYLFH